MPDVQKSISNLIGKFDHYSASSKTALIATLFIFAAIPVTVIALFGVRTFTPQAASGKPTSLTPAYSSNTTTPTFRWDCFCYTTKYRVYLREGDGNFFAGSWYKDVTKGSSNITSTSYSGFLNNNYKAVPASLTPGKTYYWTVSCVTGGCNTASTQAFTVVIADTQAPTVPTAFQISVPTVAGPKVHLYWNRSTDNVRVSSYYIYRTVGSQSPMVYSVPATPTIPNLFQTDYYFENSGVSFGVNYAYKIQAVDTSNNKSAFTASQSPTDLFTDLDNDGFFNAQENYTMTASNSACGFGSWPPDFNDDKSVNIFDLTIISGKNGTTERRYDLNVDGVVNSSDANIVSSYFLKTCS